MMNYHDDLCVMTKKAFEGQNRIREKGLLNNESNNKSKAKLVS